MKKFVYAFHEGNAGMRNLLGGKGAGLAEMANLKLPVPQGFTITTEACTSYYEHDEQITAEIQAEIQEHLRQLQTATGKVLGDVQKPLLVSVRSGARESMPGMMDTVLNLGLNDEVVVGLANLTQNPRFAYDAYRRFIMMFSEVVMGMDKDEFEHILSAAKEAKGVKLDTELDADDLEAVAKQSLIRYQEIKGEAFPQDPQIQLLEAIEAVFRSWNNPRANYYRQLHHIPSSWGTAVNVQEMVFGNKGARSGSGVAFSRNPATGAPGVYGEYLVNAQGEDVVAGVRTPDSIAQMQTWLPEVYHQFTEIARKLEAHYGDMQDMEFTIEDGKLFLLQTRNGKRTAQAAMKVAVDMVKEGLVTKARALKQIDPESMDSLLHPMFDAAALRAAKAITKGLPASPGAASGGLVFSAEAARLAAAEGKKCILVRQETSPEDIEGMNLAQGILTARGGMTSHAAVVARGMGKCCVSGCADALINDKQKVMKIGDQAYHEGDIISLDGSTGMVYGEAIKTVPATISGDFSTVMSWAKEIRKMNVRANADKPEDVARALELGAQGVGLTRTEHMFFGKDRIFKFREMILAKDEASRRAALDELLPIQQGDFEGIFRALKGYPGTIRLLDPPLHEFLPQEADEQQQLADDMGMTLAEVQDVVDNLHELNPMLGMRGCRLAVVYPEIAEMQVTAIIQAALTVQKEGIRVYPEIMVPLISDVRELKFLRKIICQVADRLIAESGQDLPYLVGTMMEIPRACLTADEVATEADFFSFGTNDLTQMGYGLSRDDAGRVLDVYYQRGIFDVDPTAVLDRKGVGSLMKIAGEKARAVKSNIHLGICGEHGGEPSSIKFCHQINCDYISCSPFRVPIAILAAAQAQVEYPRDYESVDLS